MRNVSIEIEDSLFDWVGGYCYESNITLDELILGYLQSLSPVPSESDEEIDF